MSVLPDLKERIAEIEREIRETPYNKATERHIGRLRAKLARLKEELQSKARGAGGGRGFAVKKSGDASVALVGFPSVGKSTLLNRLTNAESEVADYDFTTLKVIPGMMEHRGARIQILDMPGLIKGASAGRGRGREILSAVRSVDLIMLLVDATDPGQLEVMRSELESAGVRLNQEPPDLTLDRRDRGGLRVESTVKLTHLDEYTLRGVLEEYGVINADVTVREDITLDRLVDSLAGNRVYLPALIALNKIDLLGEKLGELSGPLKEWEPVQVSAKEGANLDVLRDAIYGKLNLIRVYLKPRGGAPDYEEPLMLRVGSTVADLCRKLHREFLEKFRYAQLWGKGAKFAGQRVGLEHELKDGDVVSVSLGR